MIGGRHCGDAAHHAEHWREQRPPVLKQQRGPDQEDSDAAEGVKVSRSKRMSRTIAGRS